MPWITVRIESEKQSDSSKLEGAVTSKMSRLEKRESHPKGFVNVILVVFSLIFTCGIGEAIIRQFFDKNLTVYEEERSLLYRFDELLGWFPKTYSSNVFTGSRTISVSHNSRGFRDVEHTKSGKPGIMFIGDSFVWGYDVEQPERFTEKLRSRIPEWEIFNLGVSGYGTDQEYLLLNQQFDYYKPRLVFLVFCTDNDDNDNISNSISNGAYYKPYYELNGEKLSLKGVPVPKSLAYFVRQHPLLSQSYIVRLFVKALSPKMVRNDFPPTAAIIQEMHEFVYRKGSQLVVGLVERQPALEHFMNNQNIPYVQLNGAERYSAMWNHWTPKGHDTVSNKIHDFLFNAGLLETEKKNR